MTVDPNTLESFNGKEVILHKINDEGKVEELTGKIESASAHGVAFKEKGKRDVSLVLPDQIEEVAVAPIKPKSLPQKKLKQIAANNVRQHLLDRHGMGREQVNAMDDDSAWDLHEAIDHTDLGHRHKTDAEEAEESGSDESASED